MDGLRGLVIVQTLAKMPASPGKDQALALMADIRFA
jgi:hypothetical protein